MNKIAVIDIGSNSVRLMTIANGKVLYKKIRTTRLGEGLAFSKTLQPTAVNRTLDGIGEFLESIKTESVEQVFAYATAAVRSAENGQDFVEKVFDRFSLNVEVLSGEKEAEIGILGALGKQDGAIVDIGGASTEIIAQTDGKIFYEKSLNIGVVRIKDLCGRDQKAVNRLGKETVMEYGNVVLPEKVYAIGGSATTLAALALGLEEYDGKKVSGVTLTKGQVREIADKLFTMTVEKIAEIPCVDKLRAEVLAGGVEWLCVIMEHFSLDTITVSDGDNLEGYAVSKGWLNE